MGKLFSLISALLIAVGPVFAGSPSGYEWWFDNDVLNSRTGDVVGEQFDIQIDVPDDMPRGAHFFNCRISTDEGNWSSIYRKMFYSLKKGAGAVAYECWFDNDLTTKTTGDISSGSSTFSLDVSDLKPGAHFFNCRLSTEDGVWGSVYRKMIFTTGTALDAVAYEYWLDTNYDSKVEGALVKGDNVYTVDLKGLRKGLHSFNYRMRNGSGDWGSVYSNFFYLNPSVSSSIVYEYWFDNDYAGKKSLAINGSLDKTFEVDMSGFDMSGGPHFFNLRIYDKNEAWSSFYRRLIVPFKDVKAPVVGYRHYANGVDLGYVPVERSFVDSYNFIVDLPDSMRYSIRNKKPIFDVDTVSIAAIDTIVYKMQVKTELGWGSPKEWNLEMPTNFSATAFEMEVNSRHTFDVPAYDKFVAVKFETTADSLYFRSDIPIALDLYRDGEKVAGVSASELAGMAMIELPAGQYYGILSDAEGEKQNQFTFHIMDTPNCAPAPVISYNDSIVSMTCSRSDVEIHYTVDGSAPELDSEKYVGSFELKHNAVVKAIAYVPNSDLEPSSIAEYVIDSYKTATPTGEFDVASRMLTLKSETKDAEISYTLDRESEWTKYESPIRLRHNCTVYAKAIYSGYHDSDIAEILVSELPDSVPTPVIAYADSVVSITCDLAEAEIHYTVDGSEPTMASARYEASFDLAHNATVKAIAYVTDLDIDPSPVAEFVIDSYKTATPTGDFDVASRMLTLKSETKDAEISYTFEREGDWTKYESPIRLRHNCTVYAKAIYSGYHDSDIAEILISELPDEVPAPVISYADGKVTITCGLAEAEIHYTVDGSEPTMASAKYESSFDLAHNATIKAIAYVTDLDIDASPVAEFVIDSYKTATPTGDFDVASRMLTLMSETKDAEISYSFDKESEWTKYESPIRLRHNCTVYAKAIYSGYHDSDIAEILISELPDEVPAPVISYADGKVTITCGLAEAEIHYTIDGSEPTMASAKYESSFDLAHNATVKTIAYVTDLDIDPSPVAEFVIDTYKTATPTGEFDVASRMLTLKVNTEGAEISYRLDSNGEWMKYTTPIKIAHNCTVYAKASCSGYKDSDVAEIVISQLPDAVPAPKITYNEGMVTISCDMADVEIHYTIDGSAPTKNSAEYRAPFQLSHNATVKAIAYVPDLDIDPSPIAEFVVDSYKTATPTGEFDVASRMLTIRSNTEGAEISYRLESNGEWTKYESPIKLRHNCTVYAKATYSGYKDSDVAEIVISQLPDAIPLPEISYEDEMVTITCSLADAEIHYTVDGTEPTLSSEKYDKPFQFNHNGIIRARAFVTDLDIDPSGIAEFAVNTYKTSTPEGKFDFEPQLLTITCDTEGASISYSFDINGEWKAYEAPIKIERNCTVYAKAAFAGYNDSDVAEIMIGELKCSPVKIAYNGRYVTLTSDNQDEEIRYSLDGFNPKDGFTYNDVFDAEGICKVLAVAVKDGFLDSEVTEFDVKGYADDIHAETAEEGMLESCYGWTNRDMLDNLESLKIEGLLNADDYSFVRTLGNLRHLDISDVRDTRMPDAALANMRLVTVRMPADMMECGDSVFNGNSELCAVVWNSETMQVEQRMMDGFDNPNLLLYMPTADVAKESGIVNRIVSGRAASIVLTDGYPFHAPIEFSAGEISYTRNFSKGTVIGQCSGWETITLPFDVETVKDYVGEAVPYEVADKRDRGFWLYMPGGTGWDKADRILAYQPYLICMPNNPDYVESYNIHGDVTFSAKNTDIAATPDPEGYLYKGDYELWPSFNHTPSSAGRWLVNDDWYEGDVPGSVFVENLRDVRPFECYVTSETSARRIPIFDDSGIDQIMAQTGTKIWHENHDLCILSGISRTIRIFDTVGQLVRTVEVEGGVLCRIQDLTPGIYLVDHTKVIIH